MKGLLNKPVLIVLLLSWRAAAANADLQQDGSGDEDHTFHDLEDLEDIGEDEEEGSGGRWDDLLDPARDRLPGESVAHPHSPSLEDYYEDNYPDYAYPDYADILNSYPNMDDEYDYLYRPKEDDSVLRIEDEAVENDVEIRPKPETDEQSEFMLETSQIFIMVGSAFVSFAIIMLSFLLCKRMLMRKAEKKKRIPFTISSPDRKVVKESSIVKDYHKVPTTTKELLQNPHVEMYREESKENPAAAPLVQDTQ